MRIGSVFLCGIAAISLIIAPVHAVPNMLQRLEFLRSHRYGYPAAAFAGGAVGSFLTYQILKGWYERKLRLVQLEVENRVLNKALVAMSRPQHSAASPMQDEGSGQQLPETTDEAKERGRVAHARHELKNFMKSDEEPFEIK